MRKYWAGFLILAGIFCSCKIPYTAQNSKEEFYTPGKGTAVEADSQMLLEISPYKVKLDSIMNEVVATSLSSMEKGQPESKLGNFVADLCLLVINEKNKNESRLPVDFCVLNNGGLRSSLPAGTITRKNIFELMPFENELVSVQLKGESVFKLLDYIASKGGVPVSNLRMKLDSSGFSNATINGKAFDKKATYTVLTSDYLANGGDGMSMFADSLNSLPSGIKVRDAIFSYLQQTKLKGESLNPVTDGRISR